MGARSTHYTAPSLRHPWLRCVRTSRQGGRIGARRRRVPLLFLGAVVALGALAIGSHESPARAATRSAIRPRAVAIPGLLEVSNSCVPVTSPPKPFAMTVWGSRLLANQAYAVIDDDGYIPVNSVVANTDAAGTFEITFDLAADPAGPELEILWLQIVGGPIKATRDIRYAVAGAPACPKPTPPRNPCLAPGSGAVLRAPGLLTPLKGSAEGFATDWYIDYPGAGRAPTGFATSSVSGGAAAANLPSGLAPGSYNVTAFSRSHAGGFTFDDAYTTFPIKICAPVVSTTTTTTTTIPPTHATPHLSIDPGTGPAGSVATVHGSGFAPGATVVLAWRPGMGTATAVVDASGGFTVPMLVFGHDLLGPRQVFAVAYPPTVSANYLVQLGTAGPPDPGGGFLFRQ